MFSIHLFIWDQWAFKWFRVIHHCLRILGHYCYIGVVFSLPFPVFFLPFLKSTLFTIFWLFLLTCFLVCHCLLLQCALWVCCCFDESIVQPHLLLSVSICLLPCSSELITFVSIYTPSVFRPGFVECFCITLDPFVYVCAYVFLWFYNYNLFECGCQCCLTVVFLIFFLKHVS